MRSCHIIAQEQSGSAPRCRDCTEGIRNPAPGARETTSNANRANFPLGRIPTMFNYSLHRPIVEGFSRLSSFATLQLRDCDRVGQIKHVEPMLHGTSLSSQDQRQSLPQSPSHVFKYFLQMRKLHRMRTSLGKSLPHAPDRDNQWIVPPCTSPSENSLQH